MTTPINISGIEEIDVVMSSGSSSATVSNGVVTLTLTPPSGGGGGVNAQSGTSYTVQNSDNGKLVTFSNASPIAVTLPQAGSGGGFNNTWFVQFENRGAGMVTITPTTSTIDGTASFTLTTNQGVIFFSDGTNYFTQRGTGGGGGGVTSVALTMPAEFSVTGSPVTSAGTLAVTKANQNANIVLAGPTTGSPAAPTFRSLVTADLPAGVVQSTRQILTSTGLTGGGDLSADRTLSVVANTTNQQVKVDKNGTLVGTRKEINLIEGSNVTLTVADNSGSDRVDVTIASSGGTSTPVPVGIPDLFWYFTADSLSLSNNVRVQKWSDKYDLLNATATGATYLTGQINSLPALSFPSASNGRYAVSPATVFADGFTAFVVFKANTLTPTTGMSILGGLTGAADLRITNAGKLALLKAFTAIVGTDTTTLSVGTWYQANVTFDLTNWAFRVARAAGASGVNANTFTAATSAIGWSPADAGLDWNGFIAELIVYDRKLGSTEVTTVENYLFAKYGV